MKGLYISLTDAIKAALPEVKFIDLYEGQDEDYENHDQYSWPAVFIQFNDLNWQDGGSGVLEANNALISLRVCSLSAERATRGRDDAKMPSPALLHLNRLDRLNKALQGNPLYLTVDGKEFCFATDLQKGPQQQTAVRAGLKVDVVGYRATVYDYSSSDWANVEDVTLEGDIEAEFAV